jgi:scyllo-inositol 2-dehydrogenase (NADP+)
MRTIVIGLGVQGKKRQYFAGKDFQFSIDPFNDQAIYKNLDDVDFNSFDSALLCIPDEIKFEYVKRLVLAGKHVLIEKPFNLPNSQLKEIEVLARKTKSTVYVAYNHRFEPHWITTKKLIEKGEIGKVYKLNLFYGNGTAELVKNSVWRDKDLGVIPDLASHLFDLVDFWFGLENYNVEIVSVNNFENKTYDNAVIRLVGSPEVILEISLLSWRNNFRAEVIGNEGSIHLESLCKWGPSQLILRDRKRPSGKPDEKINILVCSDPTWESEYKHFSDLISKNDLGNLESNVKISNLFDKLREIL